MKQEIKQNKNNINELIEEIKQNRKNIYELIGENNTLKQEIKQNRKILMNWQKKIVLWNKKLNKLI